MADNTPKLPAQNVAIAAQPPSLPTKEFYDWFLTIQRFMQSSPTGSSVPSSIFINVKDDPYNAQGDDDTDDTDAIQAAIDAAGTAGGGTVFFPVGIYQHTGLTVDGDSVTLLGAGRSNDGLSVGSRLLYLPDTGDHVTINGANVSLINLGLVCDVTPTDGIAIYVNNGDSAHLERLWLGNVWNGIWLKESSTSTVEFVEIHPHVDADFGWKWSAPGARSDVCYINRISIRCESASNSVVGFFMGANVATLIGSFCGTDNCNIGWLFDDEFENKPELVQIYGLVAEASTSYGVWFNDVASVDLTDHYININGGRGVWCDAGAEQVRLNGGQINFNGDEGIYVDAEADNCYFTSCVVQDNSQNTPGALSNAYVEPDTTNFAFIGGRYGGDGGNGNFGIEVDTGASDWYRILGVDAHGNTSGGVSDGGSGADKAVANNLG